MNRWGILALAIVTSLVVTTTAALGAPSDSSAAKPQRGTLVLASGSGAAGIPVGLRGRIPVEEPTRVQLQRLEPTGYVAVAVSRTDGKGAFSFTTHVPGDRATASYRVSSKEMVTPTRTVVTGTTTRLTQDPDPTKEPIERIGAYVGPMSADGRYVPYVTTGFGCCTSLSSLGVLYLWDRQTAAATRITSEAAPTSSGPMVSGDGRYVAYTRNARWDGEKSTGDVLVWDRVSGSSVEVTSNDRGSFANSISGDGRFVVFTSVSPDLVANDTNHILDLFVWDRESGAIRRITPGEEVTSGAVISADGRWVTFTSTADDLVGHDTNELADVFIWEAASGKTRRITRGDMNSGGASLSADGRFVAYLASEFYPKHPYNQRHADVYVWDRSTGKRIRVTAVTDNTSSPMISADGNHVVYLSHSTVLVPGDANGRQSDVFVWDRRTHTTTRVVNALNARGRVISGDGSHIAYSAGDLDGINGPGDVYLWDRTDQPPPALPPTPRRVTDSTTVPDATGDVVGYFGEGPVPEPERTLSDVSTTTLTNGPRRVRIRVDFADLQKVGHQELDISVVTKEGARRHVELEATPGAWSGRARMYTGKSKRVCRGLLGHSIDYQANRVKLSFPGRCAGNPVWVKFGILAIVDDNVGAYADDAFRTRALTAEDQHAAWSSKVYR